MEIRLEEIESFELIELKDVYDINVKDNHNYHLANDILVHNSSKTYSLCQILIIYAINNPNKVISIVRKTFPSLRATVMRDFFEVLKNMDLYDRKRHNKTENIYEFSNGAMVEFFSVDDEQKIRGRKRDIAWINEGNEIYHDEFLQLNMRTTSTIIVDYNPSDSDSWIYNLDNEEKTVIKSTYKDNPFISDSIKKQIENLKYTDEGLYQIYALGERAITRKNIYSKWKQIDEKPEHLTEFVYGCDFGYQHPTAITKIWYNENEIYIETLLCESYLTTPELINKMEGLNIDKNIEMACDYARPEIIKELQDAGYSAINANKAVMEGITYIKEHSISFNSEDKQLLQEYQNYSWKKVHDKYIDEPVKAWDDIMDSIRYGMMLIKRLKYNSQPLISF